MNRKVWVIIAVLVILTALSGPGLHMSSAQGQVGFHCTITDEGERIVAEAVFRPNKNESELHYTLKVRNLVDATMAHLHLGNMRKVNTAILWLYPPAPPPKLIPGSFSGVLAQGTISADDLLGPLRGHPLSDLIREMRAGHAYMNIHTMEHPEGGICGEVHLVE